MYTVTEAAAAWRASRKLRRSRAEPLTGAGPRPKGRLPVENWQPPGVGGGHRDGGPAVTVSTVTGRPGSRRSSYCQ